MTSITEALGLLTPADVAPAFDCTPAHIEDQCRRKLLPGVKVGREWRLQVDALREVLRLRCLDSVASALPAPAPTPTPSHRGKRKELLP